MDRSLKCLLACVVLAPLALAAGASVRADDAQSSKGSSWVLVTPQSGGFSVEMPAKPSLNTSRTRRGPGGTVKIQTIGCQTGSGVYLVFRADLPTAIARGAEDAELNEARDDLAKSWNGKVIREKRVRAQGRLGRDFTIQGRPANDTGVLTIRVREYLVGKSVFSVAVVSAPNRELPEDAGRFLGSLALGPGRVRATGTPGPEPTGRELAGWGLAIDPDNDCMFAPADGLLSVAVPGTWHDLHPDNGKLNAPRVMRSVEGDFIITVKVEGDFKPGSKSSVRTSVPFNGAGLLIWNDADNYIRLERAALLRGGKITNTINFEEREGGYRGAVHSVVFPGGPCYLRIIRKGSRIWGAVSADGKKWKLLRPIDTVWHAKLKVGLAAINSSNEPFTVRFEDFKLQTGGR